MLPGIELPHHQNLMYLPFHTAAVEQSLRAAWDAASQAAVLILPQMKLNLQLSSCASFSVDTSILAGKSHGQSSLVGYSPWDHKESDTTAAT